MAQRPCALWEFVPRHRLPLVAPFTSLVKHMTVTNRVQRDHLQAAMNASKLRLYHRLQIAAHSIRKAADRTVLDAAGITVAQAAVLTIAASGPNVAQRDVAKALRLNESAVTAMVSRLLKLGLLERTLNESDS